MCGKSVGWLRRFARGSFCHPQYPRGVPDREPRFAEPRVELLSERLVLVAVADEARIARCRMLRPLGGVGTLGVGGWAAGADAHRQVWAALTKSPCPCPRRALRLRRPLHVSPSAWACPPPPSPCKVDLPATRDRRPSRCPSRSRELGRSWRRTRWLTRRRSRGHPDHALDRVGDPLEPAARNNRRSRPRSGYCP